MHTDKVDMCKQLPLSQRSVTDHRHELPANITKQLLKICQSEGIYYSLVLDESTDTTDCTTANSYPC
jgi:hypothetical protein